MAYACVQDIASSWTSYENVSSELLEPPPAGLIAHVAGPTDEGVRIIEIWDTEESWEWFRTERLALAIAKLENTARPEPSFRALHAQQAHYRADAADAYEGGLL